MGKMDEIIVVAPRKEVFADEALTFQGVNSNKETTKQITDNLAATFSEMRRGDAEENNDYKQPIPYCVIKRGDEVFSYTRLSGGGETRLHGQISLGVGGHVNTVPEKDFYETLSINLQRELEEELIIDADKMDLNTIGLINDDANDVGKVHLGMLVIGELPVEEAVLVRETDQLLGKWIKIKDLKSPEIYDRLESWSQFVADILY
ncbi:hypothetical protein BAOM_2940 [Peribacillus asahii]|uniref:Nudix hydrolase domain-containing protein n=1 Tax=Peribacillus asahii TaxID=228899 RepID=A0A3Q9RNE0_9BACI|nr:hypothetical protein [Peribacillus asahii]AZV43549.1 hypothetical protein BAOM_2940 [Peribacillus asahii]